MSIDREPEPRRWTVNRTQLGDQGLDIIGANLPHTIVRAAYFNPEWLAEAVDELLGSGARYLSLGDDRGPPHGACLLFELLCKGARITTLTGTEQAMVWLTGLDQQSTAVSPRPYVAGGQHDQRQCIAFRPLTQCREVLIKIEKCNRSPPLTATNRRSE